MSESGEDRSEQIRVATPEENAELSRAFISASIPALLTAVPSNRFTLSNSPFGGNPVLTFGNAMFLELAGVFPKQLLVNVISSVSIAKNVAEDLVVNLERVFNITEEDKRAARARQNPALGGES